MVKNQFLKGDSMSEIRILKCVLKPISSEEEVKGFASFLKNIGGEAGFTLNMRLSNNDFETLKEKGHLKEFVFHVQEDGATVISS